MILYQQGTALWLLVASLPLVVAIFLFYSSSRKKEAFYLVIASAVLIRLCMISIDPFLQYWDERFHALVARNMMEFPFKPMLVANPVLAYNYQDWWNSHIWIHKQPLFLWQMALSMKLFGVGTFALRLPMAIMGTISVWLVRDIAQRWTRDEEVAFISTIFVATSWYALELTSGFLSLEHNDFTFYFYVTAGIWAWTRYLYTANPIKWVVMTGVFVGCAILVKWLTAFVVFGGWGLYILMSPAMRLSTKRYVHIGMALLVTCIVFIPWQVYIMYRFPLESAWSYAYNAAHIYRDLGHGGPWYFHFKMLPYVYHPYMVVLLIMGLIAVPIVNKAEKYLSRAYIAMILVIFGFFSFVATRMPAFVFPVSGLMFILMAFGLVSILRAVSTLIFPSGAMYRRIAPFLILLSGYYCMQAKKVVSHRHETHAYRNKLIHNSTVYKNLDVSLTESHVILNCPLHEQIELMFYKGGTAYAGVPDSITLDSLQQRGNKFAAFEKTPGSALPQYVLNDPEIVLLKAELH